MSYADLKQWDVKYQVGEHVFPKVSQRKIVLRFGHKGKLSLRFIDPDEVVEIIGHIAYRLKLSCKLDQIYDVFHVSKQRKYCSDEVEVRPYLTYKEDPVKIVAREVKVLRNNKIPLLKVLW
ncbi:uncharacterized protein LOC105786904 [Gossypium raimondii]|uniref:uncharacterized protein LOC105786904 n=1 Tax=Gossypium raimondii TaxID=29730 RepID=UPI00063AAE15|nr:uncharacterized protein LOC105786904 [Gossypium raimondii]